MSAEGGKEEREVGQGWDRERAAQRLFASSSGGGKEWRGNRQGQEEERGSVWRDGEQTRWNGSVGLTPDLWRGVDELLLEALALGQAAVVDLLTDGRWSC